MQGQGGGGGENGGGCFKGGWGGDGGCGGDGGGDGGSDGAAVVHTLGLPPLHLHTHYVKRCLKIYSNDQSGGLAG